MRDGISSCDRAIGARTNHPNGSSVRYGSGAGHWARAGRRAGMGCKSPDCRWRRRCGRTVHRRGGSRKQMPRCSGGQLLERHPSADVRRGSAGWASRANGRSNFSFCPIWNRLPSAGWSIRLDTRPRNQQSRFTFYRIVSLSNPLPSLRYMRRAGDLPFPTLVLFILSF